ncbi:DUF1709-domain-containing protein [Tothia fuscella]|uniref:DUF1709-domain-containing protein n=1 Tax=Tothia fuscella TaxID=1048955 RepID=A0A9P4NZE1_9PEZI|nr:DUF1709-domain-containing protein [Tothia fuscella]
MAPEAVQPLRINKSTPSTSPVKANGSAIPRPLTELSPMERRRNSPSYNQITKQMILNRDSSPFDPSPSPGANSPRDFWKGQTSPSRFSSENNSFLEREREQSPSVAKRRSIEKLMQASRVKNSSMFAREQKNEYDPTSVPVVERPLAANRPLSVQVQGNAYGGRGIEGLRQDTNGHSAFKTHHRRGESQNKIPFLSPTKANGTPLQPLEKSPSPSPSRQQSSPTKSSLSTKLMHNTFPRAFDPNSSTWSEDEEQTISPPRALRRHAKSVTFDHNPPEVNEYEMVTPDPSSVASGSRQGSFDSYDEEDEDDQISLADGPADGDDSFDASLEDTDKTPVVLPEDWRHMSPDVAGNALASSFEDPFAEDGRSTPSQQWHAYRTASVNSDNDARPLPPVPGFIQNNSRPSSSSGLASVAERVQAAHAQRTLPTPPRAAMISKSDLLGMKRDASVTLEDRLRLMGLEDQTSPKESSTSKEAARLRKHGLGIHVYEDEVEPEEDEAVKLEEYKMEEYKFPRISRESILRKVKSRTFAHSDDYDIATLDPDVPIPSREASSNFDEEVADVPIKQEEDEDPVDLYSIHEMYGVEGDEEFNRESSVIHHDLPSVNDKQKDDDAESCYSNQDEQEESQRVSSGSGTDDGGPPTPTQANMIKTSTPRISGENGNSLPEFSSFIDDADFQSGLASYMSSSTPPPPQVPEKDRPFEAPASQKLDLSSVHQYFQLENSAERHTPEPTLENEDEPGTPDSVVHHPIHGSPDLESPELESPELESPELESPGRESPDVPIQIATVKAPGGKLKIRPSATPADMETMAATRRQVSGQHPPPIPDKSPRRQSMDFEPDVQITQNEKDNVAESASPTKRRQSFKKLEITDSSFAEDISFDLDQEFDRVIESSKKGYLMRQNTKMVIAKRNFSNDVPLSPTLEQRPSSAGTRSAGPSPRKASHERAKSWTTEPWNGKARRKSIRTTSGSRKSISSGPIPPLPGQESAVTAGLGTVMEDSIMASADGDDLMGEGVERGRLFVKVVGVKDLDLPLPPNEQTHFQLTLDNGLHCVTTSWLELGRTAPIGQEFELVVLNDLEFQLTLQTRLTPPAKSPILVSPVSPTKSPSKSPAKKSSFANFLMSPKKRREADRLAKEKQEEEEKQRLALERRRTEEQRQAARQRAPTAYDLLHELVGSDGSFGRAYVSLKNHESHCFGRPIMVDMPIFNEWALEDAAFASSVKSKRGGTLRRPPYEVGKLTLQLLYVPRPKSATEDDMPKSMNACIRELREAEEANERVWEGHLSQQGGDCPYWRRRFFRLEGTNLTAFHETTRQPRAKIDLAKAAKLIDDKGSLLQPDTTKASKGRRKSAFDEDEAYQFVEEGFRIRFANGETIDFYADNAKDKEGWMAVLSRTVGKSAAVGNAWCQAVLAQEKKVAKDLKTKSRDATANGNTRPHSADGPPPQHNPAKSSRSVPSSPVKQMRHSQVGSANRQQQQQQQQQQQVQNPPQPRQRGSASGRASPSRRKQIQSMIF